MKKRKAGLLTKILILSLAAYAAVNLISLQKQINEYIAGKSALEEQVDTKRQTNAMLTERLEAAGDYDTVQDTARNKLGMVAPGEKIFIDISK